MNNSLTVYKASAGSGKTFTLAVEYIKLLVQNPACYRNILAVTFTNKATEEMKMRIISQLYGIWRQYPDSRSYVDVLCKKLQCSEPFLRKQVGVALHLLLHDYSFFRIETIDSFFQSVLRNLARELDLTANLRLELNDRQVEEMAVDRMIDDLKETDDVMRWIMEYIYENMQEDKSWNVIKKIKSFGASIFEDFYKDHRQQLKVTMATKDFFADYVKSLKSKSEKAVNSMKETSASFFDITNSNSLGEKDFAQGKRGVYGFFQKISEGPIEPSSINSYVRAAYDSADNWVKKSSKNAAAIKAIVNEELYPLLKYAVDNMGDLWKDYQSVPLSLRHLYQLRLLDAIETKVRHINEDTGSFLLSDTQHLLQSLVSDNDSPFIFEKIGSYLEYIMIDEFQDTSVVQWQNFKVLLLECMSHANSQNIIVGDVKQSIYRWRSGDWRLLNDIENQFDNSGGQVCIEPLRINYRSNGNVVHFNNEFFIAASTMEHERQLPKSPNEASQLEKAYSDVSQDIPSNREGNGLVSVALLPSADYEKAVLENIVETVRHLTANGVEQSKIAIITRYNYLIPLIANYFIENCPDITIVSDEAYRLDSSPAVKIIVEALHLLTHPQDLLSLNALVYLYQTRCLGAENNLNSIFIQEKDLVELLPEEFVKEKENLLLMPLYDLAENLCRIFDIEKIKGQTAYVCTFLDSLTDFATNVTGDIDSFVREWNESIFKKTISGDKVNGIRALSIHKSKGLEYDNVIVPFCDWQLEKTHGNMIWCTPEEEPYNRMPLLPVDYSKKALMGTIFEKDYYHENLQNTVDNLNLLYVALTRASRNLFVIGKRGTQGNSRSQLIENCLPLVANKLNGSTLSGIDNEEDEIRFEYGTPDFKSKNDTESQNILLANTEPITVADVKHIGNVEFKQSNKSREFIEGDDDTTSSYIKIGSLLHNVLSQIKTADDIDNVIENMEAEGLIDNTEISKQRIANMLHKRIADTRVSQWFSPDLKLYNECTIIQYDKKKGELIECRPDRVMEKGDKVIVVDFKFGNPKAEYHDQVRMYIKHLHDMGHHDVQGYLWYVYKNNIEKVEE